MSEQSSELVVTGVDKLIDLLKKSEQIEVSDAAKKLNYPQETVQSWVDFLVEEKIVGVDYKFTKPVIYLAENKKTKNINVNSSDNFKNYKTEFESNVKRREKDDEKVAIEWKEHILNKLDLMKQFFFSEAEKKHLKEPDKLWEEYKRKIVKT